MHKFQTNILQWSYKDNIIDYSHTSGDPKKIKASYISKLCMQILPGYTTDSFAPKRLFEATKHLDHYTYPGLKEILKKYLTYEIVEKAWVDSHQEADHITNEYKLNLTKPQNINPNNNSITALTPISKKDTIKDAIAQLFLSKLNEGKYITEAQQEILEELIDSLD